MPTTGDRGNTRHSNVIALLLRVAVLKSIQETDRQRETKPEQSQSSRYLVPACEGHDKTKNTQGNNQTKL